MEHLENMALTTVADSVGGDYWYMKDSFHEIVSQLAQYQPIRTWRYEIWQKRQVAAARSRLSISLQPTSLDPVFICISAAVSISPLDYPSRGVCAGKVKF